jgi:hypothetical protein
LTDAIACRAANFVPQSAPAMRRTDRRLAPALALSLFVLPVVARAAERLPPERTFSNAPYLHRIPLRDETGNPIPAPKPAKEGAKADDEGAAAAKAFVLNTTCGKCHSDIDVMGRGWHFNFADKDAPHGRAGEPWILTDVHTRTQIPLSYRPWTSVTGAKPFHPYDAGINDFNFAITFGRHLPGGGIFTRSDDLRFKMSGKFETDCLICHTTDSGHDPVLRANEIGTNQNLKWAPLAASFVVRVQGNAQRLKDTWDPSDPDAPPGPKVIYDAGRFDNQGNVTFNLAGPVPNDRCYFCHTALDVEREPSSTTAAIAPATAPASLTADRVALENRWRHDRDIHLAKGMLCVDCHRNGADHMTVRGYEGEAALRHDDTIATLTCAGCHYGKDGPPGAHESTSGDHAETTFTSTALGSRLAAPRPVHKGLPTLHFEKLSCTACHSGPWPQENTIAAQTSMAHRLGLPRHHHSDEAAPRIQEPVFLRDAQTGKIGPYRMIYPAFWGRLNGERITPIQPSDVLAAGTAAAFGQKPNPQALEPFVPLTKEQIVQVLTKIETYKPPAARLKQGIPGATTQAATTQSSMPPYFTGTAVYVTGGKAYKLSADKKSLDEFANDAARPYAWALAHNVRGAGQALGATGCTDCHSASAPVFDGKVRSETLLTGADATTTMNDLRHESGTAALSAFAWTYPMRPVLVTICYACAILLALIVINYAVRATGVRRR